MSINGSARRALRRIPALRSLSSQEMEEVRDRLIYRTYKAGEVLWRTRDTIGFFGFVQGGEVDIEYRIDGVLVRSKRLFAGDTLPARNRQGRSQHATTLARAVTDVSLCLVPETQIGQGQRLRKPGVRSRPGAQTANSPWLNRAWPLILLMLIVALARADIIRIASGLLYMASNHEEYYPPFDPRSMSLLKYAEQLDPGAVFAYNEEGYRWFQQEKLPDAKAAFDLAVDQDPANAPALNNLAIAYFNLGDLQQSAHYFQRAVEQDPNNSIARYNLAILLLNQNEFTDAIYEFRVAGFIDPMAASPHLQQAYLYTRISDFTKAELHARAAIQLDPSQPPAHLLLGIALYNQGRYTEALASIADTLSLDSQDRVASFYHALILSRLEQSETALSILERLLATSTDHQESSRITVEIEAIHRSQSELEAIVH